MVVELEYEEFVRQDGLRSVGGTAIDPWPNRGVRALELPELRPAWLAAVDVTEGPGEHFTSVATMLAGPGARQPGAAGRAGLSRP